MSCPNVELPCFLQCQTIPDTYAGETLVYGVALPTIDFLHDSLGVSSIICFL